ncbi:MAG: SRPBCC family protein [Nitrosarchaeum sp.]|nr:SRPBCC family protein [Nitrosarchaeum sp.]
MAEIEVFVEINASVDKVWEIVSDLDSEPKFLKGTKEVKNISKNGNVIKREIVIAFRDQKCIQEIKLLPKEKIEIVFTKGIIDGNKIISIFTKDNKTILKVNWNIKLSGIMSMFTSIIKNHIENGTIQSLDKIREEAESR